MSSSSNILNDQHLSQITDGIKKLQEAIREINTAERAGLTVGPNGQKLVDLKTQAEESLSKLRQIKSVYFPNAS